MFTKFYINFIWLLEQGGKKGKEKWEGSEELTCFYSNEVFCMSLGMWKES